MNIDIDVDINNIPEKEKIFILNIGYKYKLAEFLAWEYKGIPKEIIPLLLDITQHKYDIKLKIYEHYKSAWDKIRNIEIDKILNDASVEYENESEQIKIKIKDAKLQNDLNLVDGLKTIKITITKKRNDIYKLYSKYNDSVYMFRNMLNNITPELKLLSSVINNLKHIKYIINDIQKSNCVSHKSLQ